MIEQHNKSMHFGVAGVGRLHPSTAENNCSSCNRIWDTALNCNSSLPVLTKHKRISGNSDPKRKIIRLLERLMHKERLS